MTDDLINKTTDELSDMIDMVEKEMNVLRDNLDVLQAHKSKLELELLGLNETIRKAKYTIRSKASIKESITRAYWKGKGK